MREYAWICVNMPKSVWMAFALRFACGYITLHVLGLLEHKLTFLMKIKHFVFSLKIIFLKKITTSLYKFIKESFQSKIKNPKICF